MKKFTKLILSTFIIISSFIVTDSKILAIENEILNAEEQIYKEIIIQN